jgi:predicted alpha/beta-hydrolase family hydrolase
MGEFAILPLESQDHRPLPHSFYRQEEQPRGLVIVLPGLHYGLDGPLNYHVVHRLRERGWDSLGLMYGFQAAMRSGFAERWGETLEECRQAIRTATAARAYPSLGVVGKSLGSSLLAFLATDLAELRQARLAHHTPPLAMPGVEDHLADAAQPMYLAIGSADRFYDRDRLDSLQRRRPMLIRVVEGADHGMDVPGDLEATLHGVRQVVEDTVAFFLDEAIPDLPGAAA